MTGDFPRTNGHSRSDALTSGNERIRLDAGHRGERRYPPSPAATGTTDDHPAPGCHPGLQVAGGPPTAARIASGLSRTWGRP
jgi:hypothetical protein